MSTNNSAIQLRSTTATPRRTTNTKKAAIAATALLLVAGVATQATDWFDASPAPTPAPSQESITRDLVERGLIPPRSLEPQPSANFARWSVGVLS